MVNILSEPVVGKYADIFSQTCFFILFMKFPPVGTLIVTLNIQWNRPMSTWIPWFQIKTQNKVHNPEDVSITGCMFGSFRSGLGLVFHNSWNATGAYFEKSSNLNNTESYSFEGLYNTITFGTFLPLILFLENFLPLLKQFLSHCFTNFILYSLDGTFILLLVIKWILGFIAQL